VALGGVKVTIRASTPGSPREGEHHAGVRFGDVGRVAAEGRHWHVTLDGELCENDVGEVVAGRDGRVLWLGLAPDSDQWRRGEVRMWTCENDKLPFCRTNPK